MVKVLEDLLYILGILAFAITPLVPFVVPPPRTYRMTVWAVMVIVGVVALLFAVFAHADSAPKILMALAIWGSYALPIALTALFVPRRFHAILIAAWIIAWLILPMVNAVREVE